MEPRTKVLVTFIIAALLIAGLYIFTNWFSLITGYFTGHDERTALAECLSDNGAEFYTNEYCPECEKQADAFGQSFQLITQVDCGREKENCPNIKEIPAWYVDQRIVYGTKTLDELRSISGCS